MTDLYDSLIGIPWFRAERYDDARLRMSDAVSLPESHDVWLKGAEQREHETRRAGKTSERVYVDDDAFFAWCADAGIVVDSKARSRYAANFHARGTKANLADYSNPGFRPGPGRRKAR